mmetsp:Transcript_5048/g.9035  ORF Transcript_5048/g.9035 Transcript_5048/m.9035 type:complete len:247 (+) Transcript_5048:1287-2027(+)
MHVGITLCAIQQSVHSAGVPVKRRAINVFRCGIVLVEEEVCPFYNVVLVMIENENLGIWMRFRKSGSEVIDNEFTLGFGIKGTCIPGCWKFRFILNCYSVEINSMVGICRNKLAKKQSPTLSILRITPHPIPQTHRLRTARHILRMQCPLHIILRRCLHPRRGTPRRGYNTHAVLRFGGIGFLRSFSCEEHHVDHARVEIVGYFVVEIVEGEVVFGVVEGVGLDAEVAGVDVRTAKTISQSIPTKQ